MSFFTTDAWIRTTGASRSVMGSDGVALIEGTDRDPCMNDFASFYDDQFLAMVRLATITLGNREVARDVVQDAFVSLHDKWTGVEYPKAYLRRSVINGCRSRMRWERIRRPLRQRSSSLEAGDQPVVQVVDEMADVLAVLGIRERAAIVLKFYEQRTEAEIADLIGCRPGTVGPMISRALAQLRIELTDWNDPEGGPS